MNNKKWIIYCLLSFGIIARFLPHPYNFAPIGALAIFGGLYLPKKWSIVLPLAAMLVSDIFIGFYNWHMMLAVYLSFALMGIIALKVRQNKNALNIAGGTVLGSVLFFLITNFVVWAYGNMYTYDLAGLMNCYYMAIPFFRNSILGDLLYTGVLVGAFETVMVLSKEKLKYFQADI
jgi:hypothetical protein